MMNAREFISYTVGIVKALAVKSQDCATDKDSEAALRYAQAAEHVANALTLSVNCLERSKQFRPLAAAQIEKEQAALQKQRFPPEPTTPPRK